MEKLRLSNKIGGCQVGPRKPVPLWVDGTMACHLGSFGGCWPPVVLLPCRGSILGGSSGEGSQHDLLSTDRDLSHSPSTQELVSYKNTRNWRGADPGTDASSRPVLAILDCTIIAPQKFPGVPQDVKQQHKINTFFND